MSRIIFIALNVGDLECSSAFYRKAFGVDFPSDVNEMEVNEPSSDPWYGGLHAAQSWTEGSFPHFALFPASPPGRPISRDVQIGFAVDDIEAGHQRAIEAGAELVHAPRSEPWGSTARYRDPDGNLVSITQS